jgi:type I restriction enzyme S subunit
MSNWKETTLGEIAKIKGGKRLPLGATLQKEKNTHPYIKVTNLSGNIVKGVDEYVPDAIFEKIKRYTVDAGDVVLSIVGTIGLVGQVPEYLHKANLTENCVKIVPGHDLDASYLFYYLSSRTGQFEISKNTVGAVQPKLPIYGVQNIQILLPSIEEQKEIAAILSSLDDKIDLLRKENETLEKMAQTIFKEWFVDFNFPDAQGKPYKKSGGKMINSTLGEIPEGWKVERLGDVVNLTIGRTPPRKESEWFSVNPVDIKWLSIKDLGGAETYVFTTSEFLTKEAVEKHRMQIVPKDTVLISFKLTVGRVAITLDEMVTNEAIAHLRLEKNQDLSVEYLYLYFKNFDFNSIGSTSSIATAFNSESLRMLNVLIPRNLILNDFNRVTDSIFKKIANNILQIQTLSRLRDVLLTKLMSGNLRLHV